MTPYPFAGSFPVYPGYYPPVSGWGPSSRATGLSSPQMGEISPPTTAKLSNGVTSYFQQAHGQPQSVINLFIPVSSDQAGAKLLMSRLLTEGSPATKQFVEACEQQGILFKLSPMGERFQLSVLSPAGKEAQAASALIQLLSRPMADGRSFTTLKEDMVKSLKSSLSDLDYPVHDAVGKAMYPGHPYSYGIKDIVRQVEAVSFEHVMGLLTGLTQYPERMTASMVAAHSPAQQMQLLNQAIAQQGWYASPYRQPLAEQSTSRPVMGSGLYGPVLVAQETLDQARVVQAWQAPTVGDPDYAAFRLIQELLGSMSGGFFQELRTNRGLVYGTQRQTSIHQHAADYSVQAQVDFNRIPETLTAFNKVVGDLMTTTVRPDALQTAKKKLILALRTAKQNGEGLSMINESRLQCGLSPIHPDELQQAIEQVGAVDIQRVAKRMFDPKQGRTVIGISAPRAVLSQQFKNNAIQSLDV